jgi:hypothetical protein
VVVVTSFSVVVVSTSTVVTVVEDVPSPDVVVDGSALPLQATATTSSSVKIRERRRGIVVRISARPA